MIRPNCRQRFTSSDFRFLSIALFQEPEHPLLWKYLMQEPGHLDELLDRPTLYRAILELNGCLAVSMPFYFYVLVRHALLRSNLDHRELTDYVAALLSDFALHPRMDMPVSGEPAKPYYFDLLQALENAAGERWFLIAVHIGNRALFESGMLLQAVEEKERRRAAPGVNFLEEIGSEFFRQAARHSYADHAGLVALFLTLGQAFHLTRLALNQLSEGVLHLSQSTSLRQRIESMIDDV